MSHTDLRSLISQLEADGDLVRVREEVDPDQEVTVIQHRTIAENGPALLFENVKGSPCRLIANLFGTQERADRIFGGPPGELGELIAGVAHELMPPSLGKLWRERGRLKRLLGARLRNVSGGPVMDCEFEPPGIDRLPCLKCWPKDGGPFFTLPLVHTVDPVDGSGNLGIYRLQRYDDASTGMHWQIEKGGAFHFHKACEKGVPLPISVILGGPPALTIAAIAPLPEGLDERLLAALIMRRPLDVIQRRQTGHRIPAQAEFVLEGTVTQGDMQREGPFGDHFGHYSHSADFPVFRVHRMLARRDAIFPATVVGKPPQEDYFIGCALQEFSLPLLKTVRPGIRDLWAYPETGFHPLAVFSVGERYPREALKQALGLLGEGQLSLTKVLIAVDREVDVRNFEAVSNAIFENLNPSDGLHLLAPTAQDTLDFTGPAMNTGSRLILAAIKRNTGPLRETPPPPPPPPAEVHPAVTGLLKMGNAFLVAGVKPNADKEKVIAALKNHPAANRYLFHVLVSEDVPLEDPMLVLWGWFTRFDPLVDVHPARREPAGNRLILHPPIAIDATWKSGYRQPVEFDPEVEKRVHANWAKYGINRGAT